MRLTLRFNAFYFSIFNSSVMSPGSQVKTNWESERSSNSFTPNSSRLL